MPAAIIDGKAIAKLVVQFSLVFLGISSDYAKQRL
jgi:hypothetical protein